jgi:hypothetical protein
LRMLLFCGSSCDDFEVILSCLTTAQMDRHTADWQIRWRFFARTVFLEYSLLSEHFPWIKLCCISQIVTS